MCVVQRDKAAPKQRVQQRWLVLFYADAAHPSSSRAGAEVRFSGVGGDLQSKGNCDGARFHMQKREKMRGREKEGQEG